jgi:hypothetical protein
MPRSIASFVLKPRFFIGIEFEGMIRSSVYNRFRTSMRDLSRLPNNQSNIQFGYDNSVQDVPDGYQKVEIRTKTLPLEDGIVLFEDMLSFLYLASETEDFLTNDTCGLHINISEKNIFAKRKQTDFYCHILKDFKEYDVLKMFNRLGNRYCRQIFPQQCNFKSFDEIRGFFDDYLEGEKYLSVALRDSPEHGSYDGPTLKNHRVEFRCLGNTDYHRKFKELNKALNHIYQTVSTSYVACANPSCV